MTVRTLDKLKGIVTIYCYAMLSLGQGIARPYLLLPMKSMSDVGRTFKITVNRGYSLVKNGFIVHT